MSARTRNRNRRRVLALFLFVAAAATIASFTLADTGTQTLSIVPAQVGSSGSPVNLVTDDFSFTRPNGAASIQAGIQASHVEFASGLGSSLKLDAAWLDPNDAAQVLNNPNATIWIGLYHPIYQGTCAATSPSVGNTLATMSYRSTQYCSKLDTTATGSLTSSGKLVLSRQNLAGYVHASAADPDPTVPANACTTNSANTTWCVPSGTPANANVVFVGMTIVTPGGKPAGQQNNLTSLRFYFGMKAVG